MRTDARRNRAALLTAAREVFGDRGLDAPLDEIAKRAGVGNATLYRRFADRQELIWEVFADRMTGYLTAADQALARPDPWPAFVDYVWSVCRSQAEDRGFSELLTTIPPAADERLTGLRLAGRERISRLITRAQATGELRADFTPQDFLLLLMANDGVVRRTARHAPDAWQRLLSLTIDGLRRPAATDSVAPPSEAAMAAAVGLRPLPPG